MRRFQYRVVSEHDQIICGVGTLLDLLGNEGWELVCLAGHDLILKREIEPTPTKRIEP